MAGAVGLPEISLHFVGDDERAMARRDQRNSSSSSSVTGDVGRSTAEAVSDLQEQLLQLLTERQRLLDTQSEVEECLQEADEEVQDKTSQINELERRLHRQQDRLSEERQRANDVEAQYSQLAADYARLQKELRRLRSPRRRGSQLSDDVSPSPFMSTPPRTSDASLLGAQSPLALSPLRRALSSDSFVGALSPAAASAQVPDHEPTTPTAAAAELGGKGPGPPSPATSDPVDSNDSSEPPPDPESIRQLQDLLDERETELRDAYQRLAQAGLTARRSSESLVFDSPLRPESLETIQTCQWCNTVFIAGDNTTCPLGAQPCRETAGGQAREPPFHVSLQGLTSGSCSPDDGGGCPGLELDLSLDRDKVVPAASLNQSVASSLGDDSWYEASPTQVTAQAIAAGLAAGPLSLQDLKTALVPSDLAKPDRVEAEKALRTALFEMEDRHEILVNIVGEALMVFLQPHARAGAGGGGELM